MVHAGVIILETMNSFFKKFQANVSALATLMKKELPQEKKYHWKEKYQHYSFEEWL